MLDSIYTAIQEKIRSGQKQIAVLIDPDKFGSTDIVDMANEAKVDCFFVGGSLMAGGSIERCIKEIKKRSSIPVIIFPGSTMQICDKADGILLISLISGRNADLLIGQHVVAAPYLKQSGLEVLSTGYILVDSGKQTSASYISNTMPLPYDKNDIAVCTAMAGEMLGLKMIYLDGGSGALKPVSAHMIKSVKENITVPLVVGGGIRSVEQAASAIQAGADILVVGNALESDAGLLLSIADAVHKSTVLNN
ncbi:MAG: geranylgeranylglyceryl/heptaprenylglyceryl phosphate synthase [Bacteroidia bacterium]|nr:geranylgeranylglyceryl/heptaprenylglyceryl phosphate synthase [Bacteroidia bacterium]